MGQFSIIIPVYNEAEAIKTVAEELINLYPGEEILVVDDGSSDGSTSCIDKLPLKVIRHKKNLGYGASWKTGLKEASNEIVVFYDGDGQFFAHDVISLVRLLKEQNLDMVIGQRTGRYSTPLIRKPGRFVIVALTNFLTKSNIKDPNCGLRAVKRKLLQTHAPLLPNGFSASLTSTILFIKRGFAVDFVPIDIKPRLGRSSVNQVRDGSSAILTILRTIALFDPLRIFIPVAGVLILTGTAYSLYEAISKELGVPILGAVLLLVGMMIFFFGLICDQVAALRLERLDVNEQNSK